MPHAQKRAPTVTGRDGRLAMADQAPHLDPKRWLVLAVIAGPGAVRAGLVHGYRLAFAASAAVLAAGFVAAFLLIQAGRDDLPDTRAAS